MARITLEDLPARRPRESYQMYPYQDYRPTPYTPPGNPSVATFDERFTPPNQMTSFMQDLRSALQRKYPRREVISPDKTLIERALQGNVEGEKPFRVQPGYQERLNDPTKVISEAQQPDETRADAAVRMLRQLFGEQR